MYKITYRKKNGEVFDRIRSSMPIQNIGEETSMGWTILDIKYQFNDNYYSFEEYKDKMRKQRKLNQIDRTISRFVKKYSTSMALIILVPFLILK